VQITGPGGWAIRVAQAITGDWSRYTHAGIVLDDATVIGAQPGGAAIIGLDQIMDRRPLAFSKMDLTEQTRAALVATARSLEGTPYSFLDYAALGLLAIGLKPRWIRARVRTSGHLICSQLVDLVYTRAGVHIFDDGRDSGDVTPGDLAYAGLIQNVTAPIPKDHP